MVGSFSFPSFPTPPRTLPAPPISPNKPLTFLAIWGIMQGTIGRGRGRNMEISWRRFYVGVAVISALSLLSPYIPHALEVPDWMRSVQLLAAGISACLSLKS